MSSIYNLIYGIAKLTCSPLNWSICWKAAEVILKSKDLFSMVNGSATPPTDATQLLSWQKRDKCVYTIIYLLVSSDQHHVTAQASIKPNVWPLLKAKFKKDIASSDAWKQFQLTEHGWYVKDPTWSTSFCRVGVLEFGLLKCGLWRMCHLIWMHPIWTTKGQTM